MMTSLMIAFQMEQVLASPLSSLDSALGLLALHERLCGGTNRAQMVAAQTSTDTTAESTK
jgi:hypothetical protein